MGNFNKLSVKLISNILTRLPTETVLDCKLVSKSWNNVISRQQFSQSHLDHCLNNLDSAGASDGKFTFLFVNDNLLDAYRQFHYLEYAENSSSEEQPFHRLTRMKLNPVPFKYYSVNNSCNGLVCLNGCYDNEGKNYEPVYICNPITREFVYLRAFKRSGRGKRLLTGFGYVSKTNEYKVVRLFKLLKEPDSVHVEVYTLGSGKGWRNLGKKFDIGLDSFVSVRGGGMVGSGFPCIFWQLKNGKVVGFDLFCEIMYEIPTNFHTTWAYKLGVLGGSLSGTYYDEETNTYEILLLKQAKKNGSFKWTEEFRLSGTDAHEWLGLTCRDILLCRSKTKVLIHDLNSLSSKLLVDFGRDKSIFQAIPHMNTLVSLKALGEENTKTMETADVPRKVGEEYKSQFEKQMEGFNQMRVQ
ncbi:uncharacterized protein LOC113297474 [Papaver somniferum]|uniref:uncharacterized protein LOC113297474 n=1 Tax=Papaver somniferum TaxID=3469 RepID=UPI000E7006E8|nr:uncharacterized protein LOC113297474 [Papaver somniferum]